MSQEYDLLTKQEDYDLPTVRQMVEAMNELAQMEQRRAYLEDLLKINGKYKKFIWKDPKSGYAVAIADLKDDDLLNLVAWNKRRYYDVPQNVLRELNQRKLNLKPDLSFIQSRSTGK